jgi:hypothetical protein
MQREKTSALKGDTAQRRNKVMRNRLVWGHLARQISGWHPACSDPAAKLLGKQPPMVADAFYIFFSDGLK